MIRRRRQRRRRWRRQWRGGGGVAEDKGEDEEVYFKWRMGHWGVGKNWGIGVLGY